MKKILVITGLLLSTVLGAQELSGTYMVAQRDTCNLYIDVYLPTPGSETTFEGQPKPAILYVFGGGFVSGRRNDPFCFPWFKTLNDNGYGVVAVDYRLGLKGVKMKFDVFHLIGTAKNTKTPSTLAWRTCLPPFAICATIRPWVSIHIISSSPAVPLAP